VDDILLVALLDVPLPSPQTWDQDQACCQQTISEILELSFMNYTTRCLTGMLDETPG